MMWFVRAIVLLSFLVSPFLASNVHSIFCYYGSRTSYRHGNGYFSTKHINPELCTHIAYAYFGIADNGSISLMDDWVELKNIKDLIALKEKNKGLRILASVGGGKVESVQFSTTAANPTKRANFVKSVVSFLKSYDFDGVDIFWSHPTQRGGSAADRVNFPILLRDLKTAFTPYKFLLTVKLAAEQKYSRQFYKIGDISRQVDLLNLMTYDFHVGSEKVVDHNAPLADEGTDTIAAAINYFFSQGVPSSKILMGISMYARTFTLANIEHNIVGSAAIGEGLPGILTNQRGFLAYYEVCAMLDHTWTKKWDPNVQTPYAYKNNQWISYDNIRSIEAKVDFIKQQNLAGAMVWSIDYDDFRGICDGGKYPLLHAINNLR